MQLWVNWTFKSKLNSTSNLLKSVSQEVSFQSFMKDSSPVQIFSSIYEVPNFWFQSSINHKKMGFGLAPPVITSIAIWSAASLKITPHQAAIGWDFGLMVFTISRYNSVSMFQCSIEISSSDSKCANNQSPLSIWMQNGMKPLLIKLNP